MTSDITIESLPLLARGGQADIYDLGDGKVLRFPRRTMDCERVRYEYGVYSSIADSGISAPKLYELVEVNETPAIVMERISGTSMIHQIRRRPWQFRRKSIELANMHSDVLGIKAKPGIVDGKQKAAHCIAGSSSLSESIKKSLLDILKQLPTGTSLCHGDFHPGNILNCSGTNYIIDWSAASSGDFASDVAHTYILLKVVPRAPGVGALMHSIQKKLGRAMADCYLKAMRRLTPLDVSRFAEWVLIMAAERTYYGLPSEQDQLLSFINGYLKGRKASKDMASFYEEI